MEGNLPIASGDTVDGGYDFSMPGTHPDTQITFLNASVTVQVVCPDSSLHDLVITLPTQTYVYPSGNAGFTPTGDESLAIGYQGSAVSNVCGSQTGHAPTGATFVAQVCSTNTSKINIRFHYRDNTSGSWSSTLGVTP